MEDIFSFSHLLIKGLIERLTPNKAILSVFLIEVCNVLFDHASKQSELNLEDILVFHTC